MATLRFSLLLMLLALLFPATGRSAPTTRLDTSEIIIRADSMSHDQATGIITATGNVEILLQGTTLTADIATYDAAKETIQASGSLKILKGNDILTGESAILELATGKAQMEQAAVQVPGSHLSLTGERIIRTGDNEFEALNTSLTTCALPDPSWRFGAQKLTVNLLGYAIGRNVSFYIKGVPVLYLPWIAFPVVTERKTGLLFPRVDYSSSRGVQLDIPLYLVISPSQDLLLDLDLQSKRGAGLGADYRYIRQRGSEGHLAGYLIYDTPEGAWRGHLTQEHLELFSATTTIRSRIFLDSDRDYHADFGKESGEYNRQLTESSITAATSWDHLTLTGTVRHTDDLYATDNKRTVQVLPEIGIASVRTRLPSLPLYFDLDSSVANLYRETGITGQRALLFPRLGIASSTELPVHLSLYGGVHLHGYQSDSIPSSSTMGETDGLLIPEAGAHLSTSAYRIFTYDGTALQKLRHELIPELTYNYSPDRYQDHLPYYDYSDRIIHQNALTLSLTSLLGGKFQSGEQTTYRNLSRIRLSQTYSIDGIRRDLLNLVDQQRHWDDLTLESETALTPHLTLTFDTRYNHHDHRIASAAPGITFDDHIGNRASISYRMARAQVEYLETRLETTWFSPWAFGYTSRYSFDKPGFLESIYSVEYRHACWGINLSLRDRPGKGPSFHVDFNLAGLTGK